MDWKDILEQIYKKLKEDLSHETLTNKEDLIHLIQFFELATKLFSNELDRRERINKLLRQINP